MLRNLIRVLLLTALCLLAQRDAAVIRGTVTDAGGGLIPNARVSIADERTGVTAFNTETDAEGRYAAPALRASSYTINVESAGFKRAIRRGVTLEVGQVAVLDFTLEVGQVTEAVEVTAEAPLLRTESAELGDVVEGRRVVELPLNGRFFVNLVSLTTGVTPPAAVQNPNNNRFLGARWATRSSGQRYAAGQQQLHR
jgi:Carboxypeptidase regulatory-like domain